MRRSLTLIVAVALSALGAAAPAWASPVPQNPLLAPNPFSNIHNDTWMSNAYAIPGPTAGAHAAYGPYSPSVCGSLTFDRFGQIVSVCPSQGTGPQARIIDPRTLKVLATYDLPAAPAPAGTPGYQNFTGGGYFFLGRGDRVWTTTPTKHLIVLAVSQTGFTKLADYDLARVLGPQQGLTSALPDFRGNIWFVSKRGGVVGVLNPNTRRIRITHADSEIENSFAVGRDGVYIVSEHSMYRFAVGRGGRPTLVWKSTYRNSGIHKPGQVDAGSGTTPSILPGGYVAIADNADPMDVVVYRTAARLHTGQRRVVCQVPVFHKGASDTENSLIGSGRSLVVENNYGYRGFAGPDANAPTSPGFARVDIDRDGRGCHRVWQTFALAAPSAVLKLSTATGLIYTYVRESAPANPPSRPWAWAALSFRTGRTAFTVPTGDGTLYNNNYAGVAIGPDQNAYLGTIGGLSALENVAAPAALAHAAAAVTPAQAAALGKQAYLYGFPLLSIQRVTRTQTSVSCPDGLGDAPLNAFSTSTRFAGPSDRTVIAPNVDTLYSLAHVDLGRGPVVLGHPNMGRRFFVFELLDPYTNVIGYIGSRTTGSAAGRFAITWTGHPGRRLPQTTVIRSRYRRVWVIGRTLAGDRADQRRAVALMRRYTLTPPGGARRFAPGCRPGKPVAATTPTGLAFLDALGVALARNPPPARDAPLMARLRSVGVGPGLRPQRAGLASPVLAALTAGVTQEATALVGGAKAAVLQSAVSDHGWYTPPANIGSYGTDYLYRAQVAALGLGANTPAEATYPIALTDGTGRLLDGANAGYSLVFARGQIPPARAFWSLTMYSESGFLVANPIDRYAIGSSHPPLRRRSDGSIVVIISHARPSQRDVNWLPAPAAPFRLNLRLYWPRAAALNGRWRPPPIMALP